ncbi:MAG: hypothetical protein C0503_07780 [Gemmatimonas sp.]|nr:hypothetical protein [Gemmatimonas sp.]
MELRARIACADGRWRRWRGIEHAAAAGRRRATAAAIAGADVQAAGRSVARRRGARRARDTSASTARQHAAALGRSEGLVMRALASLSTLVAGGLLALPQLLGAQQTNADGVSLRASVSSDTVFVGQQVTYTLSVRIPTAVRQRLRRNPEFVPPEPRAMLAYDLPLARVGEPGDDYEVHTFRRALFALTPGRYGMGQARLSYALPQSNSFFSREDDRTLRADGVSFVAIEPPLRGRLADWAGAVGRWEASLRAEPAVTRVGDPFVLVLRLEGTGNATLLPRPALRIPWADVVAQDERVVLDSAPALFGGAKEFTWLVTPREPGAQSVAAMSYPYFDPERRSYLRANTDAVLVSVRPGTMAELPTRRVAAAEDAALPLRPQLDGATPLRLPFGELLTWLALLAPLPWLWWRRRSRLPQRRTNQHTAESTARALLDRRLRERSGVDLAGFTAPGALAAALRLEGVTPETAAEVEALRDACDREAFAASNAERAAMNTPAASAAASAHRDDSLRTRAAAVLAKVDAEARRRALLLLLSVGTMLGCVRAGPAADALDAFTQGTRAYARGEYAVARDAFALAAGRAPRDPAAWANFGTAAWQARDTASAVVGWQRALRLDPTSSELREHLARVSAPQHPAAARIWPLPPLPLLTLALALWFAGWAWAAINARRQRRSRWPSLLIVPAVIGILGAGYLDRTLAAPDAIVIAERTPLRSLPALGADAGAVPMVGEIAQVLERRGVWLRLELDGGRSGWYPAERTRSLARD